MYDYRFHFLDLHTGCSHIDHTNSLRTIKLGQWNYDWSDKEDLAVISAGIRRAVPEDPARKLAHKQSLQSA